MLAAHRESEHVVLDPSGYWVRKCEVVDECLT